jgi:PAS domain S-box-containing protein
MDNPENIELHFRDSLKEKAGKIMPEIGTAEMSKNEEAATLLESEERFRQLADNINEVFWLISPDWKRIIYVNPAYEKIWGRPAETLYENPRAWVDAIVLEDRDPVIDYLNKKANGDVSEIKFPEFRIVRPDHSIRWISSYGNSLNNPRGEIYRIAGISRDITDEKKAEKAFNAILEGTVGSTGQAFFDNIVGEVSKWLDCNVAMIGEIEDEHILKPISMIVDGKLSSESFSYDVRESPCSVAVKNGFSLFPDSVCEIFPENDILRKLNAVGYVGVPLRDNSNKVIGLLCAISRSRLNLPERADHVMRILAARAAAEIERKNIEEENKKIEAQLVQRQKLEAIGTLAGGIAHDFNNILQSIILNAELEMLEPDADVEERKDRADNILKASHRARDLVNQILTFSREGELELKPLQIGLVLKEVIRMLRSSLPTTIEIRQDISPKGDLVLADPTRIHQVVMNLATNAAHAMKKKGGVLAFHLERENLNASKVASHPDLKPGPYLKLSVSDTGCGIEPSIIGKIFDPFFTTKPRGEGSGLGLAVAYGIARNLGGTITVESKLETGSVFSFLLPRIESNVVEKPEKIQPLAQGKERILLVDDDKGLVHGNCEALRRLGYEVTAKYGSLEALEAFKAEPEYFDLVITDQTMPRMTGSQLAQEMIKIKPDVSIMLCTGFSHSVTEEKAKAIGIKKFLMKPVILREMSQSIRDILDTVHPPTTSTRQLTSSTQPIH